MKSQTTLERIVPQRKTRYFQVAPGVWGMKIVFVNIYMVKTSDEDSNNWILIDAGLKGSTKDIIEMAESLFGKGTMPSAIILTHGHFDHVGCLKELLKIWNTQVFSHPLEMPYLTGKSSYPPPDPSVGGGFLSLMSWTFPKRPINLGNRVKKLSENGVIPGISGWTYIHTPGHAPGHISLFREKDRTLIAGDAFVTTKQESIFSAITQAKRFSGPPKYFTNDWIAASESVKKLADLQPEFAGTGHGVPVQGEELKQELTNLSYNFSQLAIPKHGRYVKEPAIMDKKGVQYVPPKDFNPLLTASIFAFLALGTYIVVKKVKEGKSFSGSKLLKKLQLL